MKPAIVLLIAALALPAKDRKPKPAPQDNIEVVGHIPSTGGAVLRFLETTHYSSTYLYAEHEAGKGVTLIDVSRADRPKIIGDVSYPASTTGALYVVSGTSAVVSTQSSAVASAPQTIRIFDLSDPLHPQLAREFANVTATEHDAARGLLFIANSEGIWILHENRALDPEVEKAYAHHVLYDR